MKRWSPFGAVAFLVLVAQPAAAGDISGILGRWNVISTQTHGSCGTTMAGTLKSETWDISALTAEEVTAQVVPVNKKDIPPFPQFKGRWDAETNTLTLQGGREPQERVDPVIWWQLTLEGDRLVGVRRWLGVARNPDRPESLSGALRPCFEDSAVEAEKVPAK